MTKDIQASLTFHPAEIGRSDGILAIYSRILLPSSALEGWSSSCHYRECLPLLRLPATTDFTTYRANIEVSGARTCFTAGVNTRAEERMLLRMRDESDQRFKSAPTNQRPLL